MLKETKPTARQHKREMRKWITCSHGIRIPSSQGARDLGSQKTRVVNSHGTKVANGPSIRIASRVVLSPSVRTPNYVNLFN